MKKLVFILTLLICTLTFGQIVMSPFEFSKNKQLSIEANLVFKTNKYLDFKKRDTLVEIINDTVFKKTDLNNYFGYKKNWEEIENETFETYKINDENYKYSFQDSTMFESYNKFGSYDVKREVETIYNSKGFIKKQTEKVFVGDNYNETRIIINEFDNKNRVTKITQKTKRKNKGENSETIIEAIYEENIIIIKSKNGTMICKFIIDKNVIGFISKLNPRETSSNFMYAIGQRNFDLAKEYCTDKMAEEIQSYSLLNKQIESVKWLRGSDLYSSAGVQIEDVWELKFATNEKANKTNVEFRIIKQKNGWKIDYFKIIN